MFMNSRGGAAWITILNGWPEVRTGQAMLANRDTEVVVCCAPVGANEVDPWCWVMQLVNSQVCVCQPHLPRIGRCRAQVLHLMKSSQIALNTDSAWIHCNVAAFQSSPPNDFLLANACNSNYSGLLIWMAPMTPMTSGLHDQGSNFVGDHRHHSRGSMGCILEAGLTLQTYTLCFLHSMLIIGLKSHAKDAWNSMHPYIAVNELDPI